SNWGDPHRATPCADYFPIIWAQGDVAVHGGAGQGVLLAEGDVTLDGGTEFIGVIVARDDIRTGLGGARVFGVAMAGDRTSASGDHTELTAGGVLQYSSCALDRSVKGSAGLKRVKERSWAPLYE